MKPLLNYVDAVLFDLDGTLVETNIDFALMKREVMALAIEAGMQAEAIEEFDILGVLAKTVEFIAKNGNSKDAEAIRQRGMSILEEIELRHARKSSEIDFARELLERLRKQGIGVGIVTRNCRSASEMSIEIVGIEADVLICREDSSKHKPHPEPVILALSALNAEAWNSIMVGDHIIDVQAGKAAGTKTIGFLRENRPHDFFDNIAPDFIACNLREVLDAIICCNR